MQSVNQRAPVKVVVGGGGGVRMEEKKNFLWFSLITIWYSQVCTTFQLYKELKYDI